VSGGHTMLIESKSLSDHQILAESQDIAIGDYLDKVARFLLSDEESKMPYGKALEDFAFEPERDYLTMNKTPQRRQDELERHQTGYQWSLTPPLAQSRRGDKSSRRMEYSFTGLLSSILRVGNVQLMGITERRELAREAQRVAFEHLGSRILLHLDGVNILNDSFEHGHRYNVVVSGGVASNKFLRHVLRSMLDVRGYQNVGLLFPPPELCTDNALMIAWAGIEMYDAGHESELSIEPLRKWSMDPRADDGGILGVAGWKSVAVS
jgi:N6-L-threonylcarbamoyladenine synthase